MKGFPVHPRAKNEEFIDLNSFKNSYYRSRDTGGYNTTGKISIYGVNNSEYNCLPNCVGYVWGKLNQYAIQTHKLENNQYIAIGGGNAKDKYNNASSLGYDHGSSKDISAIPANSFLVYSYGTYGHVVYVESNNGTSLTVSDSGYSSTESGAWWPVRYEMSSVDDLGFGNYIGWVDPFNSKSKGAAKYAEYSWYAERGGTYDPSYLNERENHDGVYGERHAVIYYDDNNNLVVNGKSTKDRMNYPSIKVAKEIEVTRTGIVSASDQELDRTSFTKLLTYNTLVQTPFVLATIGGYTFGSFMKQGDFERTGLNVKYPNFIQSATARKINGSLNTYTVTITYNIRPGDDPNFVDKILGHASSDRKIVLTYGDYSSPTFVYREEEALITNVRQQIDFARSSILYTISCTSNSYQLSSIIKSFYPGKAQPSELIRSMLRSNTNGLLDMFPGMRGKDPWVDYIPSDDKVVDIEPLLNTDVLTYINYLTTYMSSNSDTSDSPIKSSSYFMTVHDDLYDNKETGGAYFKVSKISSRAGTLKENATYEVDIGYPDQNKVLGFTWNTNESYSILYNYQRAAELKDDYTYFINESGDIESQYSQRITRSDRYNRTTERDKSWWTDMTRYPTTATLRIKGLMKPILLMSYIRINSLFYGQRHISSGLYVVTSQEDSIMGSGYTTILTLQRIAGDEDYLDEVTTKETVYTDFIPDKNSGYGTLKYNYAESSVMSKKMKDEPYTVTYSGEEYASNNHKVTVRNRFTGETRQISAITDPDEYAFTQRGIEDEGYVGLAYNETGKRFMSEEERDQWLRQAMIWDETYEVVSQY